MDGGRDYFFHRIFPKLAELVGRDAGTAGSGDGVGVVAVDSGAGAGGWRGAAAIAWARRPVNSWTRE